MRYRLLGPLTVGVDGGAAVSVASSRRRAILGALLLEPNRVLSVDQLIDAVWGTLAPGSAVATLRSHVCNLRKLTGDALRTQPPGYLLAVADGEDDVSVFRRWSSQAAQALAAGDLLGARQLLHSALALWRGPVLADVCFEQTPPAVVVLEELRLSTLEDRIEVDLALGRHREVIPELRSLVELVPLRESLHRLLMLALYQSGRQAEALQAYERARTRLRDELGIDPSPMLQHMDQAILRHDECLEPVGQALGTARAGGSSWPGLDRRPSGDFGSSLATFRSAVEAALDGSGRPLVLVGDTEAVTSSFVEACAGAAAAMGVDVLRPRPVTRRDLASVLGGARERARAGSLPVVLVLDTLDRASDESIDVVRRALHEPPRRGVLIVAAGAASSTAGPWADLVRWADSAGPTVLLVHDRRGRGSTPRPPAAPVIDLTNGSPGGGPTHTYATTKG